MIFFYLSVFIFFFFLFVFFQAEDGIRDLVRSRGLGDVYKRQDHDYDEIKELDNRMPPWLAAVFIVTTLFACIYFPLSLIHI